ncbi:MAG: RNA polymerase sigma factor [Chloroflexota bacterium]
MLTLTPQEEQATIRQAKADRQQFRPVYRAYVERIYSYVAYRVSNQQDAEDIVSKVFIKALYKLDQYDERYPFGAWLFGIARNTIIDHYRRNDRQPDIIPFPETPSIADDHSPEAMLSDQERAEQMRAYIANLSRRRQEVVTLRFYAGMPNKEIAELLDLDERTIASHLSRALTDLQTMIDKETSDEQLRSNA